ncbi:MAG: hypothetical protein FGF53_01860 [Candidatus Brockarchaeota archaeon]|nr:hypothetical protein [Candidatus Brockarchaeota archaeon]MBO3808646.1 hypothetical protein [Candidatus Brockarchaeota archaeon]MBO3842682.1 hypothetical protein [Candidatus Brockarchaeota archaeon]
MVWRRRKNGRNIGRGEFAENPAYFPVSQAASASQVVYDYLLILNRTGASQMGDRVL